MDKLRNHAARTSEGLFWICLTATLLPVVWFIFAYVTVINDTGSDSWVASQFAIDAVFCSFWAAPAIALCGITLGALLDGFRRDLRAHCFLLVLWLLTFLFLSQNFD